MGADTGGDGGDAPPPPPPQSEVEGGRPTRNHDFYISFLLITNQNFYFFKIFKIKLTKSDEISEFGGKLV